MSILKYFLCLTVTIIHSPAIYTVAEIQRFRCNDDVLGLNVHNYLVKLRVDTDVIDYDYFSHQTTYFCSGSIIDKKWIISVAHCFPDNVKVTIMSAKERILGFSKKIIVHPDFIFDPEFNYYNGQNDLALVKTEKPIQLNAFTQLIGLARLGALGSTGIIAGYEISNSEFPLEGVAVVNQCECAPNDSLILCAQSLTHMESTTSGAALKTDDGLIGILSHTASLPTGLQYFVVDISIHFEWIKKVTKKTLHRIVAK